MADLLWALLLPLLICAVIFFVFRFFLGLAGTGRSGGGGGGFGLIAFGWIISAIVKATGAIIAVVLDRLVFPLVAGLGRGADTSWRYFAASAMRRGGQPAKARRWPKLYPPWDRRCWIIRPEDEHLERSESRGERP